ncbi:hypothetical protein M758_6G210200 [Ceratodon purpureus]|nr:hypothetical protein M758_6G210200 [Ceratodon purpureus]
MVAHELSRTMTGCSSSWRGFCEHAESPTHFTATPLLKSSLPTSQVSRATAAHGPTGHRVFAPDQSRPSAHPPNFCTYVVRTHGRVAALTRLLVEYFWLGDGFRFQ